LTGLVVNPAAETMAVKKVNGTVVLKFPSKVKSLTEMVNLSSGGKVIAVWHEQVHSAGSGAIKVVGDGSPKAAKKKASKLSLVSAYLNNEVTLFKG
jgi:hypothetical protein